LVGVPAIKHLLHELPYSGRNRLTRAEHGNKDVIRMMMMMMMMMMMIYEITNTNEK